MSESESKIKNFNLVKSESEKPGGFLSIRKVKDTLPYVPQRDLGICLIPILRGAVYSCQLTYDGQRKELEILDTISSFCIKILQEAKLNRLNGLLIFQQLYNYIKQKGLAGDKVFATFCGYFLLNTYAYLFSTPEKPIGSLFKLEKRFEFNTFSVILSLLDEDLRISVVKSLVEKGCRIGDEDLLPFMEKLDDYLTEIAKSQGVRYARNVGSDKGDSQ